MKAAILVLFLFPILYGFAQEEQRKPSSTTKPSTTDCPTWNKKGKQSSKAAYFQYLRSPKTKVNQQATFNDFSKIQPNSVLQKNENSNQKLNVKHTKEETTAEKVVVVKPEKTEKNSPAFSKKNNTANSSANEKNTDTKSVKSPIKEGEAPFASIASSEEKNTNKDNNGAVNGNNTKSEIKDNKKENRKIKRKLNRLTRKTTKVGRRSNAKCPSF